MLRRRRPTKSPTCLSTKRNATRHRPVLPSLVTVLYRSEDPPIRSAHFYYTGWAQNESIARWGIGSGGSVLVWSRHYVIACNPTANHHISLTFLEGCHSTHSAPRARGSVASPQSKELNAMWACSSSSVETTLSQADTYYSYHVSQVPLGVCRAAVHIRLPVVWHLVKDR